ncbi:microtubule-associated protein futsch-like [Bombus vosnesenskii]|uniref:Microtubule-associated protein futsch-like n=1 Tax=Bombus vosnesenskii TaxID=207650 RepID=A0A6J3KPJ5_9HYME|nr:microtubule-associated protein futsch-like [Bombus vosnesenskii]
MKLSSEDEKEKDESKPTYVDVSAKIELAEAKLDETTEKGERKEDVEKTDAVLSMQPLEIKDKHVEREEHIEKEAEPSMPTEEKSLDTTQKTEESGAMVEDRLVELKVERVTKQEDRAIVIAEVPVQDIVKDVKVEREDTKRSIMELSAKETKDVEERHKDVAKSVEVSMPQESIKERVEVKEKVEEPTLELTTKEENIRERVETSTEGERTKESIEEERKEKREIVSEVILQESVDQSLKRQKRGEQEDAIAEVTVKEDGTKEKEEYKEEAIEEQEEAIAKVAAEKESTKEKMEYKEEAVEEEEVAEVTAKEESRKEKKEDKQEATKKVSVEIGGEEKVEDIEEKETEEEKITDAREKEEELHVITEAPVERKLQREVITERETERETKREEAQDEVVEHVEKQEKESEKVVTDVIVRERVRTPEIKEEDVVREKSTGRRIITEETTIIYKVQKDGTLVQEQVLKSVQVEGGSEALAAALVQLPESKIETKSVYEVESTSEVTPEITFTSDIRKEMQKLLEGERATEIEVKDKTKEEITSIEEEKSEKASPVAISSIQEVEDREIKGKREESRKEEKEEITLDKKTVTEMETKHVRKEFESRIPVSTAKIDKDKMQKETKPKSITELKQIPSKLESDKELSTEEQEISPTTKKKEFESRIPKRVIDIKPTSDKAGKKDTHVRKESESYTITEKKSSEEVTSKLEEHLTTKSETQTFSKSFVDPQEAFKMFEDMESAKSEFATVTSKIDHKTSTTTEKKEVVSSEISNGRDKVITLEEKERVERKKSSESRLKKESPTETLEEKKSKHEELDKTAIQKLSMNLTDTQEIIDAAASESRTETKKEETLKKLSDKEGVMTREAGSSLLRESDADVAIRIKKDIGGKRDDEKDEVKTVEGKPATERISKPVADSDHIETLAQGESRKESKESFDVIQFVPSERRKTEEEDLSKKEEEASEAMEEEATTPRESLEEKQRLKFKEIEARTIAETLIQSIEREIEAKSAEDLKAELLGKGYLEQIISESVETDHEKLADDLTRKFESIMRKTMDKQAAQMKIDESLMESPRLRSSIQEESLDKSSTRDSISVSEDITKDEESSPQEKEESFPLSSSQAKLQDRDITMSPSSISEQIDFEETIDVDTDELESVSKPISSAQSEKQRFSKSSSQMELQRDFQSDVSLPRDKIVSEISGARVLEILEPGVDSQSREDSVDVPSLEMDEHKISEQTSRGIPSLHESAEMDSFDKMDQERDITISPSTVSEDTNIDYSLVQESSQPIPMQKDLPTISTRRADSFEIESPPLVSPKPKVRGLEIKPVDWMIGDEKIEISETLQPSQIFNQELEAYESMKKKERLSSLDGSTDHEQESGTKSSEEISVIESTKETVADNGRDKSTASSVGETKLTAIPVSEQDFDSELVENKLDVSCQELVDTLQREYDAKTPIKEYIESIQREISGERIVEAMEEREVLQADESASQERPEVLPATTTEKSLEEETREERIKEDASSVSETSKREEILSKSGIELKLEKTTTRSLKESEKPAEEVWQETTDSEKPVRVDDVLKEWTEAYLSKMKPLGDDYKRHMEKATEKHDKPGRSTTVPSDTCAFKIKKDDLPSVDLSARYAITVLDQVVKKEIAEVKESLEAAKQDLIEELSENSETVIQIKDSPSEFRFKLQPESIPNDLPFLYTPSFPEQQPHESDTEAVKSESPIDKSMPYETKDSTESKVELEESTSSSIEEPVHLQGDTPVIKTEKSDAETAAITVHEDTKDDEEEHPSPVPASRSGSDIDNKDESSSLALPRPVLRRRQKPGRSSKRVASDSDADLGSSSGESSNYQSCDYEIGSGSRPSSSDVEALQSCGVPSATASEYETAMMSIEHSSSSKPTSQEYHTAATTMSSRESMKSLTSLSSGHLGSIDSTSELSETLVPSETDAEKEEVEERLDGALEEEHTEQSDSSGSDIPIDEPIDNIYSSIPCRMKRSSEMIFPQVLDNAALEVESTEELTTKDAKGIDFATSTLTAIPGTLRSVDIMTSRVSEHGVQSVCTQVISTQTTSETESSFEKVESETFDAATAEKDTEEVTLDVPMTTESELLEQRYVAAGVSSESPEMSMQTSTPSIIQQTSMSTSSTSGVSIDTVVGKEKSDRHSPDSDSFEMVDKPDIIDDFVVIEEVGKEAEEYDSEGKSIRISSIPQASSKQYDRDLENLITENKQDSQVSTSQTSKNNELFDFESEESPPQVSNDDQYSQSYSDEEQYEGGKKWIEMQFHADPRVYDIEYDRGPLEDIKEEEITDFEAGSSRFGSLGSHKESIGSVGSMRGSFGSTPDYDVLTGKKYFTRPSDHDNVSLSSLQEFENLESAVAAENSKRLQCGSHDSVNNGSLPRRYMTSRSGHGDDISLSSLKDFEGLEKACREAHLIELRAREEEDLLEHESPENKYKLESLPRTRIDTSTAGSFNASTSGSDDYEKRIKEIDEIIRIAQSNVEKFDRQDDTTEDISQIEITDVEKIGAQVGVQSISKPEEPETVLPLQRESNVMETSTDSLELEDNMDKKHHPLCRSSDSLEMKTTLDFPSLSSDSLNNVRDAKEMQSDVAEHASSVRRISSDSLDMPLLELQDAESRERPSNEDDHSDGVTSDNSLEQRSETVDTDKSDKMRTTPSTNT